MRLKFWRWAHDRAEALWHWIYYHKIAPEVSAQNQRIYQCNVTFSSPAQREAARIQSEMCRKYGNDNL